MTKEPTQVLTDGRYVLGEIYTDALGEKFTAKDVNGHTLGSAPTIEGARTIIIETRRKQVQEAARNG